MFSSRVSVLLPTSLAILLALALAGCGGGDKAQDPGPLLATVGGTELRGAYYEDRLAKLAESELPKGEDGRPLDMAAQAGKEEFLQSLINKELMKQKALQLGYGSDPQVMGAREAITAYEAGAALWADVVGNPANTISEEELQAYYANMGKERTCRYVITNFIEDAEKARELALGGADWSEVVAEYHDGSPPPTGKYEIVVPYGRYGVEFETPVFATEVGGVTPPIKTSYGFWILKVDAEKQGKKPDLEAAKAQVLDVSRNRKMGKARADFLAQVRESHKLFIDEDALWICYQGLPKTEVMIDEKTNKPTPGQDLEPLDLTPADMGRLFYSYEADGEVKEFTLGDYKIHFDKMNVFQRPKRSDMLGGLRQNLQNELEKGLVNDEAETRGYFTRPDVVAKVDARVEEIMVTRLYGEVVVYDERITPEQLDEFWATHGQEYTVPTSRTGQMVVCRDAEKAAEARTAILGGLPWAEVLVRFGTDAANKSRSGKLERVTASSTGPVAEALFALGLGEVSGPVAVDGGKWVILRCELEEPGRRVELSEVREAVGQRMKKQRQEEAFQALLAQWTEEFGVQKHPENLAGLASWKELTTVEVPENLVPRNTK